MKRILSLLSIGALVCVLGVGSVACSDAVYDPLVPDEPREIGEIKVRAGISDDDFCRHIDIEEIHRTIPVVNRYIDNLPGGLDAKQRAQALVALFRSFAGITDARLFQDEYMRSPAVFFSFMDGPTERELGLDFSSTGKVLSYRYDVTTGVYAKVRQGVTIDRVFGMINSLDLEVNEIIYGTHVSSRTPSEAELKRILDALNAKPYTNDGDIWWTYGYLHHQTGRIVINSHLFGMHDRARQADWLAAMSEYGLADSPDYGIGYAVEFSVPEDDTIPASHWTKMFEKFDILEAVQLLYNRYTLADETIGNEGYEEGVTAIDSKIHISPIEEYKTSPRTFQLFCATERAYSSGSNPIIVAKERSGSVIDISFKGVAETGMTADIGPARAYIDLGALAEGTYTLNLHNGDVKQTGRLVVTAESYLTEFADSDTFGFTVKALNRIPDNTIWGYVGKSLAESFFDDIAGLGAEERLYAPGYYREFDIDENGNVVQPEPYDGIPARDSRFVFHYEGDPARIGQLLEQYWLEYGDNAHISVYTDKGEEFLSWMYGRR